MVDNVDITPGSGKTVRTDDVGGIQTQVMKIALGADGAEDCLLDSGQQTAANSVPVVLPADQITTLTPPAAITGYATSTKQDDLLTELQKKADITETQPVSLTSVPSHAVTGPLTDTELRAADVKVTLDGESVGVTGTVTANTGLTQPLTDTQLRLTPVPVSGTVTVTDGDGSMTVDGTVTANLSATDNAVLDSIDTGVGSIDGKLSDTNGFLSRLDDFSQSDGSDEMRVNVIDPLPAGTALIGKISIDQATANANEVVVKSGTVTADLGATDNAVLDDLATKLGTIDTDTGTLAGAVAGTEVQVDVVAALPAGDNNIGNVDVVTMPTVTVTDMTDVKTSVQLLDDTVFVDDAAFTPATSKVLAIGAVLDATTPDSVDEGDIGALRMNADRALHVSIRDSAGNNRGLNVDSSNRIAVTVASTTSITPGTAAANLGKAEDALHSGGDVGVMMLGVRNDSNATNFSGANGDYTPLAVDAQGNLQVDVLSGSITAELGATDNAVLDDIAAKLATIDADTSTLAAAVSTEVQVDVVGSLPAGTNAIGKLAANSGVDIGDVDVLSIAAGDNNIGNVDVATIAAGETHIGSVGSPDIVITLDATPDTSALADGDVAFATQEVANAARVNAGTTILQSVTIADVDDQKKAIDLIFFDANTTLGTENSAPDIDDTEVQTVLGRVSIAEADYYDLGANSVACVTGIGLVMKAGAATTSLYVAGIARGAPTYAGGHLYIKLGFLRN